MGCLAGPSGQKQGGEGAFLFFLFSEFSKSISNEFLNQFEFWQRPLIIKL
jgi:hypothetical protein